MFSPVINYVLLAMLMTALHELAWAQPLGAAALVVLLAFVLVLGSHRRARALPFAPQR